MRYYIYKYVKGVMYRRNENPNKGFISAIRANSLRDELAEDAQDNHESCEFIVLILPSHVPAPIELLNVESIANKA